VDKDVDLFDIAVGNISLFVKENQGPDYAFDKEPAVGLGYSSYIIRDLPALAMYCSSVPFPQYSMTMYQRLLRVK
jgi:hypothetical protein